MKGSFAIRGLGGLLLEQQQLWDARLAGAVGPKQHRDGGEPNVAGVFPCLEVLDAEVSEHGEVLSVEQRVKCKCRRRGAKPECNPFDYDGVAWCQRRDIFDEKPTQDAAAYSAPY